MSHPRIEEVTDSEDDVSDPSEGDIDDFRDSDILRAIPTRPKPSSAASASSSSQQQQQPIPQQQNTSQQAPHPGLQPGDIKDYQMLYPIYFDASRTRSEGRRVSSALAVHNPLAREIANACAALRLSPVFEAHRTHPKDWANPGRVRVALKEARSRGHPLANKHHLYVAVAKYLAEHPAGDDSAALRQGMRGMGLASLGGAADVYADGKPWPRPAKPRGWKMGDLLPAYSAAMTGGGVSENAFKDMMREMQGPGGAGGGMPGGMPAGMPGMNADMMSMLQNMGMGMGGGGGGGGPAIGGGESSGGGGGGKKGKKGRK